MCYISLVNEQHAKFHLRQLKLTEPKRNQNTTQSKLKRNQNWNAQNQNAIETQRNQNRNGETRNAKRTKPGFGASKGGTLGYLMVP